MALSSSIECERAPSHGNHDWSQRSHRLRNSAAPSASESKSRSCDASSREAFGYRFALIKPRLHVPNRRAVCQIGSDACTNGRNRKAREWGIHRIAKIEESYHESISNPPGCCHLTSSPANLAFAPPECPRFDMYSRFDDPYKGLLFTACLISTLKNTGFRPFGRKSKEHALAAAWPPRLYRSGDRGIIHDRSLGTFALAGAMLCTPSGRGKCSWAQEEAAQR